MKFLQRFHIDGFILSMVATVALAAVLPASGVFADVLDIVSTIGIGLLFFVYGVKLSPRQSIDGLKHWRLHSVIVSMTFLAFPLAGIVMQLLSPGLIDENLYRGLLFLCLVPSTVQSSIAFTSVARGNVAGAIVTASLSSLIGVFLTPLLVILLMTTSGTTSVGGDAFLSIILQILVPFLLGQMTRRWLAEWLAARPLVSKVVDRGAILLVVYAAFSAGMIEGIWSSTPPSQLVLTAVICLVLLALALAVAFSYGKVLGFSRPDRVVVLFCGSNKSLAAGLPMAAVLFGGGSLGMIVLPLMIYHQAQLIVCAILAQKIGRTSDPIPVPTK